jgi:hypothetical protein
MGNVEKKITFIFWFYFISIYFIFVICVNGGIGQILNAEREIKKNSLITARNIQFVRPPNSSKTRTKQVFLSSLFFLFLSCTGGT